MPATYGEMLLNDPRIPRDTDIQARLREGLKPYWDKSIGFCYVGQPAAKSPARSSLSAPAPAKPGLVTRANVVLGQPPSRQLLEANLRSYFRPTSCGWRCDALDSFADTDERFLAAYVTLWDTATSIESSRKSGFREVLRRGAFLDAIDIDAVGLWVGHRARHELANTRQPDRLKLIEDEHGLIALARPAMTGQALGTIEAIHHGDFSGMSFLLQPDPATTKLLAADDGHQYRDISRVRQLSEVSVVAAGANPHAFAIVANYATLRGGWRTQSAATQWRDHMRQQVLA